MYSLYSNSQSSVRKIKHINSFQRSLDYWCYQYFKTESENNSQVHILRKQFICFLKVERVYEIIYFDWSI